MVRGRLQRSHLDVTGPQHLEHGEHTPMLTGGWLNPELVEDVFDVRLDRLHADMERFGDADVGAALGHELESLVLWRREGAPQSWPRRRAEQQADDFGVDEGPAADDRAHSGDKRLAGRDSFLEKVTGRSAGGQRSD